MKSAARVLFSTRAAERYVPHNTNRPRPSRLCVPDRCNDLSGDMGVEPIFGHLASTNVVTKGPSATTFRVAPLSPVTK
jgi:hypothetical protein